MTPPLVVVHWAEHMTGVATSPSTWVVMIACVAGDTSVAMMTADGQSGLDGDQRRFDFDTTRVTCLDCKARIAEALQVRP